jgi:hypothetical protein
MPGNPGRDRIHIGALTARIMALAQATRAKILIVDDDELELALFCESTAILRCAAHQTARRR